MDELASYIFNYYSHLLTHEERAANRTILGELKIEHDHSPEMKRAVRKFWGSTDPKVLALLQDGAESFWERARDRVLREQRDQVFLNHCPQCGALAKTPTAKQCPKCFFSWHGEV